MSIPLQNPINVVHQDENWRQRVDHEMTAAQQWPDRYWYLKENHTEADVGVHQSLEELDAVQSMIGPCRTFMEEHRKRKQTRRSIGNMIMDQEKPGSRSGSRPGSSSSAPGVLKMTTATALSLQPSYVQGVGACIATPGVDPNIKYRHPQASSQVHGWSAKQNLEFFGVSRYGRKSHAWNAQHDI